ncbi:MAG: hypothetical protein WHU10_13960, partial [Fimbriimonadales bacterium]
RDFNNDHVDVLVYERVSTRSPGVSPETLHSILHPFRTQRKPLSDLFARVDRFFGSRRKKGKVQTPVHRGEPLTVH